MKNVKRSLVELDTLAALGEKVLTLVRESVALRGIRKPRQATNGRKRVKIAITKRPRKSRRATPQETRETQGTQVHKSPTHEHKERLTT